jgi:hypothetical protein
LLSIFGATALRNGLSGTDAFGIAASSICAVHCIATPIAMAILPSVAGEAWESPLAHQVCASAVAIFCLMAAYQGYKQHSDWKVLMPLALGLLLVICATFLLPESWELYEMPILCTGSAALVIGHIWNLRRLSQCCKTGIPCEIPVNTISQDAAS